MEVFEGFSIETIDFMWNLRLNNNKPWFLEHKEEFQRVLQRPMKLLAAQVYDELEQRCGDRGFISKVSRIYKDARRPQVDGPYRDHLWMSIERPSEDWTYTPTFWFELTPESWQYGLGYYMAKPITMAKLRARIDKNPKVFEKLIAPLNKQEEFVLEGPEYVRKKEAPTKKTASWYNRKSFVLIHRQENGKEIFEPDFAKRLTSGFEMLMPIYDYIVTLDADPDPV